MTGDLICLACGGALWIEEGWDERDPLRLSIECIKCSTQWDRYGKLVTDA